MKLHARCSDGQQPPNRISDLKAAIGQVGIPSFLGHTDRVDGKSKEEDAAGDRERNEKTKCSQWT